VVVGGWRERIFLAVISTVVLMLVAALVVAVVVSASGVVGIDRRPRRREAARGMRLSSNQGIIGVAVKLILVIFGILSVSAAQAQNAPWCLSTPWDGSLHCTYATFQQCLADRTGSGFCIQNSTYQPPSSTIRRR
jgi:Protein of unknown function (DUF3551)